MVRISKWIVAAGVMASATSVVRDAHAQYWLQDRGLTEGHGIRLGNFELHPGIGAEGGFDSNPTYVPAGHETPAGRLRITPSISLSTLGPQRTGTTGDTAALPIANFRAGAAIIFSAYFGNNIPKGGGFGIGDSGVNVGGSANFALELFPGRAFRINLSDTVSRTFQGQTDYGVSLYTFNRIQNFAAIEAVIAPNGQRGTFDVRIGYTNALFFVESSDFSSYRNMMHEVYVRNRWQFLPKTALTFDASFLPTTYFNPTDASTTGVGSLLTNSNPLRARFGLTGLITERFAITANIGYQGTFFNRGDNLQVPVGQLEAKFITNQTSSIRLGFVSDVQPSFLGNYYDRNELYLNVSQSFGGRFLLSGQVSGGYYRYGYASTKAGDRASGTGITGNAIVINTDNDGRFHSFRIVGNVFGEYRFTEWFGVNVTLGVSSNITDATVVQRNDVTGATIFSQQLQWTRFEGLVGVRVSI